jgi:hypothetical protein
VVPVPDYEQNTTEELLVGIYTAFTPRKQDCLADMAKHRLVVVRVKDS